MCSCLRVQIYIESDEKYRDTVWEKTLSMAFIYIFLSDNKFSIYTMFHSVAWMAVCNIYLFRFSVFFFFFFLHSLVLCWISYVCKFIIMNDGCWLCIAAHLVIPTFSVPKFDVCVVGQQHIYWLRTNITTSRTNWVQNNSNPAQMYMHTGRPVLLAPEYFFFYLRLCPLFFMLMMDTTQRINISVNVA